MRHAHVSSGGRYPVLRTLAVLYLVGAVVFAALCVWRIVAVFSGGDLLTNDLFGAPTNVWGKVIAAACWLAAAFIGVLALFAVAELIKLFIDLEHNSRVIAQRMIPVGAAAAVPTSAGDGATAAATDGPALPFVRDRKLFEGEETAEGALIRGH